MDKNFDFNEILVEWSYRMDRGYPNIHKIEDREVLKDILQEMYGSKIAKVYLESIEKALGEVALGLNKDSLRHENEHVKYTKRFIETLKTGGEAVVEKDLTYKKGESIVKIPAKERVEIDSTDDVIGKLVAALRGVLKFGPDFPEENPEAKKALARAEKIFTYEDGGYKRVVPIKYKGKKIKVKLNDISKDTVTRISPEEREAAENQRKQAQDNQEDSEEETEKPPSVSEIQHLLDEDDEADSEGDVEEEEGENKEEDPDDENSEFDEGDQEKEDSKEDNDEGDDDEESDQEESDHETDYVDREDDGKDDYHPDRKDESTEETKIEWMHQITKPKLEEWLDESYNNSGP